MLELGAEQLVGFWCERGRQKRSCSPVAAKPHPVCSSSMLAASGHSSQFSLGPRPKTAPVPLFVASSLSRVASTSLPPSVAASSPSVVVAASLLCLQSFAYVCISTQDVRTLQVSPLPHGPLASVSSVHSLSRTDLLPVRVWHFSPCLRKMGSRAPCRSKCRSFSKTSVVSCDSKWCILFGCSGPLLAIPCEVSVALLD